MKQGWVGVDLDGTLAQYDGWMGEDVIGEPVEKIVDLVRILLKERVKVKIFTARASDGRDTNYITRWARVHLGEALEVTNVKDLKCIAILDDRAVSVESNTGRWVSLSSEWRKLLHSLGYEENPVDD